MLVYSFGTLLQLPAVYHMLGYNPDRIRPPINYRLIYIFSYNTKYLQLFMYKLFWYAWVISDSKFPIQILIHKTSEID
jgi:hypothetical protein